MKNPRVTIIIPAFHEQDGIRDVLERIDEALSIPFECLIVIDSLEDPTVKVVKEFSASHPEFLPVLNSIGNGAANAIKQGFEVARAEIGVVTMADGSDDPECIESLVRLVERGVTIASASRYMPGGQQIGAPFAKSFMSKIAGLTLWIFAGVGTHDSTNSFKAYQVEFVRKVKIESKHGFELGIELIAKAKRLNKKIAEIPTTWIEREVGASNFQLRKWIPFYLGWYVFAFGNSSNEIELLKSSQRMLNVLNRFFPAKG